MKTVRRWLALCLAVCLCFTSFSITEAAKKTVIVKTQKQLKKALKEGKASKIILKTTKNIKITIPKSAKAKNIILQVNAPNARIFNKSTFNKISLKGTKVNFTEQAADNKITVYAEQLSLSVAEDAFIEELKIVKAVKDSDIEVKGSVETITTRSDNANITVGEGAKVETIRTVKKDAKVNIIADGTVGTVTVAGKQTDIKISGSSEEIKVIVTSKDNTLTASVPVKTEVKGNASTEVALKEGAENSEIKADNTASITVDNGTKEEIKVTQGNETTTVGSGEKEEVKGDQTPTTTTPTPTATPTPSTGGNSGNSGNNGDSDSNTQTTEEKALQAIKEVKTEADVKAFLENAEYVKAAKLDLAEYNKMDAVLQESVRTTLLKEVNKLETITTIAATWNKAVNQIAETAPICLGLGEAVEKYYQTLSETAKKEFEEMGKNTNSDKRATLTILGNYTNTDNFAIGANADVILLANSTFINTTGTLTIEEGGTIQGRSETSKIQNNSSNTIGSETDEKYKFDGNSDYIWESNAWKKVVVPKVASVEIIGDASITIPETENVTKEYTAIVKDQAGNEMKDEKVDWSLSEEYTGVEIDQATGSVTVSSNATEGSVTIVATSKTNNKISESKVITLTKTEPEPTPTPEVTSIEISGDASITIPKTENVTKEYTAIVKDQAGNEMKDEKVDWSLSEEYTGVEIDQATGSVTVSSNATEGSVTIVATSKTNNKISESKVITLTKTEPEPTPTPGVTSIEISGNTNITIPSGTAARAAELSTTNAVIATYTAVLKGASGEVVTASSDSITWSVVSTGTATTLNTTENTSITGVSIETKDNQGILTVTSEAQPGMIAITATFGELSDTMDVTLQEATGNKTNSPN